MILDQSVLVLLLGCFVTILELLVLLNVGRPYTVCVDFL